VSAAPCPSRQLVPSSTRYQHAKSGVTACLLPELTGLSAATVYSPHTVFNSPHPDANGENALSLPVRVLPSVPDKEKSR
jgi:hypothetical protein